MSRQATPPPSTIQMTLAPQFWDNAGMKYEEAFGHDQGLIDFITAVLEMLPSSASVLDIGCGTGKPTSSMIAASGRQLHGIDFSSTMIALSRQQVPGGVFEEVDMFDFSPRTPFDAAFAMFSLFNITHEELNTMVAKCFDWVVPNGYFFVGTIAAEDFSTERCVSEEVPKRVEYQFMGRKVATLLYSKEGWRALLQHAGFEVITTKTIPFQPPTDVDCDFEPHYYIIARKTPGYRSH
ncbi:hypothetical protein MMC13_002696 [Lambiella insularis]|nr:hypothetical protein [Lambiella insularis]